MRTITFIVGEGYEFTMPITDEAAASLLAEDGEEGGIASYVISPVAEEPDAV